MKNNKKGQSTIEFLSSFAFILSILFLYVKMALNITNGYLLHYATFMASRAFLVETGGSNSNGGSDTAAIASAQKVFSLYSDSYVGLKSPPKMDKHTADSGVKAVYIGIIGEIKQAFSFSKLIGGTKLMHYVSESFLGREPMLEECLSQVCAALGASGSDQACNVASTLVDNGC